MKTLAIDIETYSDIDIKTSGVYKYVDSANFNILLFAYAYDDEEVQIVDLTKDKLSEDIIRDLTDRNILKTAFNANFERTCLSKYLNTYMDPKEWSCTMVKSLSIGLPQSLDNVSKVLGFEEDKQKMKEGKSLINYFSKTCKPTKVNKGRTRNLPEHDLEKWNTFKEYCKQDVVVEREIRKKLDKFEILDKEQELWSLDQRINDRGIGVDEVLIDSAIYVNMKYSNIILEKAKRITGLDNPNSTAQLKTWINEKSDYQVNSLAKDEIPKILKNTNSDEVKEVLKLRQLLSKTSVKKYEAMNNSKCSDKRVRGLLQFYGARTGRWAGRLVQVQNLPQNHIPDLALARYLIKARDYETVEFLYDSVPDTLSQLIRTAFIPSPGCRFIVADFSAIEARVLSWLAKEQWRIDVFNSHGKIYEASASQMFHVPIDSIKKGSELRQKGKIAELALGYGGGVGALQSMDKKGSIAEDEYADLVKQWRNANPKITELWWNVDKAAKKAIKDRTTVKLDNLTFIYDSGILFIKLPSGRKIAYIKPKIEPHETFSGFKITYEGMQQTSRQWTKISTYGPKLVENIVQAIARDCLAEAMFNVTEAGYKIVMHVHDELILDVPLGKGSIEEVNQIFAKEISWAKGLPLKADGYECEFYQKD